MIRFTIIFHSFFPYLVELDWDVTEWTYNITPLHYRTNSGT